jgi:hypothetical protein
VLASTAANRPVAHTWLFNLDRAAGVSSAFGEPP